MAAISLPIYYTQTFKTKPNKTFLVGMNWYNTAHYHIKNKVKQEFQSDLKTQLASITPIEKAYKVEYHLYWKNPNSDGANIVALTEKIFLDALQKYDIVQEDNVKYHMGSCWVNKGQDKQNPRVEILISNMN